MVDISNQKPTIYRNFYKNTGPVFGPNNIGICFDKISGFSPFEAGTVLTSQTSNE